MIIKLHANLQLTNKKSLYLQRQLCPELLMQDLEVQLVHVHAFK